MKICTHVEMHMTFGGVVVRAMVKQEDGEWDHQTSVFSSVETACAYVQRALKQLEGPTDPQAGDSGLTGLTGRFAPDA